LRAIEHNKSIYDDHKCKTIIWKFIFHNDLAPITNQWTKMEPTSTAIGLIVIVALYITVGVLSAAGSVYIAKSFFSAKAEQIFFGLFLIPIAGFYLAFTAYYGDKDAWRVEAAAVAVFAVFGLAGVRVAFALIVGYLLHGLWDAVHEFNAHAGGALLGHGRTTSIPLAYGFFCATYDLLMAIYFYTRRDQWRAAWNAKAAVTPSRKDRE
jgi:hypothetical protein